MTDKELLEKIKSYEYKIEKAIGNHEEFGKLLDEMDPLMKQLRANIRKNIGIH